MKITNLLIVCSVAMISASARAQIRITEWMYNGLTDANKGEFIEFTNIGASPIDMTGWSFDDSSRIAGSFDLSAFNLVAPGESVILTEANAENFRAAWGLGGGVKIIGGLDQNLGRADEINIYDNSSALVDRLTFDDQGTGNVDGPRTQNVSGITTPAFWGANNASAWQLSQVTPVSDGFSWTSTDGDVGNPGVLAVPEPSTWALLGLGTGFVLWRRFRRA